MVKLRGFNILLYELSQPDDDLKMLFEVGKETMIETVVLSKTGESDRLTVLRRIDRDATISDRLKKFVSNIYRLSSVAIVEGTLFIIGSGEVSEKLVVEVKDSTAQDLFLKFVVVEKPDSDCVFKPMLLRIGRREYRSVVRQVLRAVVELCGESSAEPLKMLLSASLKLPKGDSYSVV